MEEIREVLRLGSAMGLPAPGLPTIAAHAGVDRKAVRRYVAAARAAELISSVVAGVRPVRPDGHGQARESLVPLIDQITT
ncbi:hypothetical protein GII33_17635 [Gordonia pseudamarae]|uniref:Uncharacterized protein n=1 Tax=Gordonia pseudamarae TaxID=2831662 RepID=A0ABX6IKF5_9ACTN|nr:hypothetical protein [Gordonia pseudamarae]MBD0021139.1 hypothetical protein [Gordonia sp. (in: high G+C Gram-positive bacteria)]QHN27510.1 hypothetical protein GII33_17635 [Gordonia pseudamarae]QHN36393.1 hypothetical protein GII31_17410 [Gordonia pseudamarae]